MSRMTAIEPSWRTWPTACERVMTVPIDHVSSLGWRELGDLVSRRHLARLQHAAERPRCRIHRSLLPDPQRLRPRRRSSRCSTASRCTKAIPISFNARKTGSFHRRRHPPAAVLGFVLRGVRPHVRPSFRLADVDPRPEAGQQPACCRGHEALDEPGAVQMQYGRRLLESRPFLDPRCPRRFADRDRSRCRLRFRGPG